MCIDRVQTECLYQSFMRRPLGKHALPAQRDSPLSGPLFSTKGAGREQFPHSQCLPHWAGIWTDTGGPALSKKGKTITNMLLLRLASHGLIVGKEDYLCLCIIILHSVALGGLSKPSCMSFTPHQVLIELFIQSLF